MLTSTPVIHDVACVTTAMYMVSPQFNTIIHFQTLQENIEDKFVFVSIDTDLFEPIYQGLLYFYERLEKGGYIFVHDYNGKLYGAKEAVQRFSEELNIQYVPLCDLCGSVIFSK